MTREKKELFAGIAVVITVYIATLWQRPLFAPGEFDFAVDSMSGQPDLMSYLNSFAGKFLKYNLVSIRLLPALSAILTALCLKKITGRFISSIIFLATPLAFIFSTAASPEMINTFFLTCGTLLFCRYTQEDNMLRKTRVFAAAAAGCFFGFFVSGAGVFSLILPAALLAFMSAKEKRNILYTVISAAVATAVVFAGKEKFSLNCGVPFAFGKTSLLFIVCGYLPWILFLPHAIAVIRHEKKGFLSNKNIKTPLVLVCTGAVLTLFYGTPALVWASPFTALLFAEMLTVSGKNPDAVKGFETVLRYFSRFVALAAAVVICLCFIKSLPANWKLYSSKMELAGFAAAITVSLIQFKIACDENPQYPFRKLLHVATGVAVLMILLPGAIPERIRKNYAPDEFFAGIAARHITPDTAIYADTNSKSAVKWLLRKNDVSLLSPESEKELSRLISSGRKVAVFTSGVRRKNIRHGKPVMNFSMGKWKITLYGTNSIAME